MRLSKPVMPDENVPVIVRRKKKTFVVQGGKAESITGQSKPEPEKSKPAAVKADKAKPVEQKAEPAKEKPGKKKSTKSQKANRRKLEKLISRWPDLFCDPPKLLAIGIYDDLLAQLDPEESKSWVKRGIYFWCNRITYKKAMAEGGPRFNLTGESGEVSPEEQQHAKEWLAEQKQQWEAKKAKRKQAEKQAQDSQ